MHTITNSRRALILNLPRLGCGHWWVEITTSDPDCIYYFGPFPNSEEASDMCPDYVQALVKTGKQKISPVIKHCYPAELMPCNEAT
ncbi:DUF1816 domain-containing protein [Pantanalinema sp. GBBB05]|uniref:DUF1816 domain-containing protein n=1 Tax=Pantanalinema sp. GBBB05 TaxID=2604139 RepID=UPI001D465C83|nr:DUF1816 domain-containing protein [Pantanalinema sp. GBBB05]